jgi:Type II intron maturase
MVFDSEKEPSFQLVRPTRAATSDKHTPPDLNSGESLPSCACFSKSYRNADTQKPPGTVAGLLAGLRAMATAFKASGGGPGLRDAPRRRCPYSEAKRCLKLRAQPWPLMFKAIASHVALRFAHHQVLLVHNYFGFVHHPSGQVKTTRHPPPSPPRAATVGPGQPPSRPAGGVNTPQVNLAARDHIIHSALRAALAHELLLSGQAPSCCFKVPVHSTVVFQRPRALLGVHSALAHIKHHWRGVSWFLAFEIKSYDTIDRPRHYAFLQERIDDPKWFVLMHQLCDAARLSSPLRRAAVRWPVIAPPNAADVTPLVRVRGQASPKGGSPFGLGRVPGGPEASRLAHSRSRPFSPRHFPLGKFNEEPSYAEEQRGERRRVARSFSLRWGPRPFGARTLRSGKGASAGSPSDTQQRLSTYACEPHVDTGAPRTTVVCQVPPPWVCEWPACFGPLQPKVLPVVYGLRGRHHCSGWCQGGTRRPPRLPLAYLCRPRSLQCLTPYALCQAWGVVKQLFKHHQRAVKADTRKPGQCWRLIVWAGLRHKETPSVRTLAGRRLHCALVPRWCAAASRHAVASKHRGLNGVTSVQAASVSTGGTRHPSLCLLTKAAGFVAHRSVYSCSDERPQALCLQTHPRLAETKAGGFTYPQLTTPSTLKQGSLLMKALMLAAAPHTSGAGGGPVAPRPCLLVRAWEAARHARRLSPLAQNQRCCPKALFKNPTFTAARRGGGPRRTWLLNQNKGTLNHARKPTHSAPQSWDRTYVPQTARWFAYSVFDLSVQVNQQQAHVVKHKQFKPAPLLQRTPLHQVTARLLRAPLPPNDLTNVKPYVRLKYTLGHIGLQQLDHEIDRLRSTFETKHPVTKTDLPSGRAAFTLSDPLKVVFQFCQGAGLSERLFRSGSPANATAAPTGKAAAKASAALAAASAAASAVEASKCGLEQAASAQASCFVPSERPVRVRYVRYANQLLLGISGTASIVKNLRNQIIHGFQSDHTFPHGLAHCTHHQARQGTLFLGFRLSGTQPHDHDQTCVLYPEREKRRRRRLRHLARRNQDPYLASWHARSRPVPLIRPAAGLYGPRTHKSQASLSRCAKRPERPDQGQTSRHMERWLANSVLHLGSTSMFNNLWTKHRCQTSQWSDDANGSGQGVGIAVAPPPHYIGPGLSCTRGCASKSLIFRFRGDAAAGPTAGSVWKPAATCLPLTKGHHTFTPQPGLTRLSLRLPPSTGRRHFLTNQRLRVLKAAPEVLRTLALQGEAALPLTRRWRQSYFEDSPRHTGSVSKTLHGAGGQSFDHQSPRRPSADDPVSSVLKHTVFSLTGCGVFHLAAQRQPCHQCPATAHSFGPSQRRGQASSLSELKGPSPEGRNDKLRRRAKMSEPKARRQASSLSEHKSPSEHEDKRAKASHKGRPSPCRGQAQHTRSEADASSIANSGSQTPEAARATAGIKDAYVRQTSDHTADDRQVVKPCVSGESVLLTSPTERSVPAHVPSSVSPCAAKSIPNLPLGLHFTKHETKRWLFHCDKPHSVGQGLRQKGTLAAAETIRRSSLGRSVVDHHRLRLTAPVEIILKLLRERGIITAKRARPSHVARLSNLPDQDIVQYYKGVAHGLLNYYRGCDNLEKVRSIVDYQIYWSALFTLANKHKTSARRIRLQIRPPDRLRRTGRPPEGTWTLWRERA